MLNWIRKQMVRQEGITLIELIVVVAIIAVLAFTITPRVLTALDNSRLNGARSVANELHSALERYYVDKGTSGATASTYPNLFAGTANVTTFEALRTELQKATVGLSNTTENVFDAGTAFVYNAYTDTAGLVAPTSNSQTIVRYCATFRARNSDNTYFKVTPAGVDESTALPTCP